MKFPLLILALSVLGAHAQESRRVKVGAGFGNGFGMLGGGLEFELHRAALLVGAGTFGVEQLSWDMGARYYLRGADRKIRPHLTLSYAPTHVIHYRYAPLSIKNDVIVFGFNILAGFDHDFGSPDGFVMGYGLGLAMPGEMPEEVEEDYDRIGEKTPKVENTMALAIGLKYLF